MAELTHLDEKFAEVWGLAKAAKETTAKVAKLEGADEHEQLLERMREEADETIRRCEELAGELPAGKTAIEEKAREVKQEAVEMRDTYLAGEEEALDGFEFLVMAEAGELGHWEVLDAMASSAGANGGLRELIDWAKDVQSRHLEQARETAVALAGATDPGEPA